MNIRLFIVLGILLSIIVIFIIYFLLPAYTFPTYDDEDDDLGYLGKLGGDYE